jgi:hypothetical protein
MGINGQAFVVNALNFLFEFSFGICAGYGKLSNRQKACGEENLVHSADYLIFSFPNVKKNMKNAVEMNNSLIKVKK